MLTLVPVDKMINIALASGGGTDFSNQTPSRPQRSSTSSGNATEQNSFSENPFATE